MKRSKNRKKKNSSIGVVITIVLGISAMLFLFVATSNYQDESTNTKEPYDFSLSVEDKQIVLTYKGPKNAYAIASKSKEVSIDDENWIKASNRSFSFDLVDYKEYFFIKYNNEIYEVGDNEDLCYVELSIENNDHAYLAIGEEYDYKVNYSVLGYTTKELTWKNYNPEIVSLENGHIIAKEIGEAKIMAYILNRSAVREITVSDLIIKAELNNDKEWLPCGIYSEEDNDLIDTILETRIAEKGYATRAGVVEAARFLTLNFPYKIKYAYEWGRQEENKIDGEGRYYLKGLYLDESRFDHLVGSNVEPQTWGCVIYNTNIKSNSINGLDCSGFVTWAILNGGFDCGDLGAGYSGVRALPDLGVTKRINDNVLKECKVGDLVHSNYTGGHIGIIIGIDEENNYYIAEATPKDDVEALVVTKLNEKQLKKTWNEIVLMDTYYLEDGNLTNMWY